MKKAYNVYKIYGKTNIPKFLRDLSFMFLLGVCFLGFQTQTTAQAVFTSGPNGSNPGKIVEDVSYAKQLDALVLSVSFEDAVLVLRNHKRSVSAPNHTSDLDELNQQGTILFVDSVVQGLVNGVDLNASLLNAFTTLTNSTLLANTNLVDPKSIADPVIDLLR